MGKLAFLFAGQGAQAPGMGRSLYEQDENAAVIFDFMEQLRPGTLDDCFSAPAERLAQTSVTQPCVYAVDLACAAAVAGKGIKAQGAAGFSLGEMAALSFAGVFAPADGARLVCSRGTLMEKAAAEHPGGMAAALRLPDEIVEALCAEQPQLWPVNYNCPGQLVVAGAAGSLPAFCDAAKQAGGMAKQLLVGGAFHTPFMQQAAQEFALQLEDTDVMEPAMPVYANLTAQCYTAANCRQTLARQMHSPVQWHKTILQMWQDGFDTFVELGPGKTLSGFVKRIVPQAHICNVQDSDSLHATIAVL